METERDQHIESRRGLRRWVLAPYAVQASLEAVGQIPVAHAYGVITSDANAWGLRFTTRKPLVEDAQVWVTLPAPDGGMLCVRGSLAIVRHGDGDNWQASMVFDVEQPRLSAARIDLANMAG